MSKQLKRSHECEKTKVRVVVFYEITNSACLPLDPPHPAIRRLKGQPITPRAQRAVWLMKPGEEKVRVWLL